MGAIIVSDRRGRRPLHCVVKLSDQPQFNALSIAISKQLCYNDKLINITKEEE